MNTDPTDDLIAQELIEALEAWDWCIDAGPEEGPHALLALRRRLLYVQRLHREAAIKRQPQALLAQFDDDEWQVPEPPPADAADRAAEALNEAMNEALNEALTPYPAGSVPWNHKNANLPPIKFPYDRRVQENSPVHVACSRCGAPKGHYCFAIRKGGPKGGFQGIDRYIQPFDFVVAWHKQRTDANTRRLKGAG